MNFDDAIKAHSDWKMKLSLYVNKPDGSLKAAEAEQDNKCALGQWIYGEGIAHNAKPEYATLKAEHTKFHRCAGAVIRKADSGQKVSEEIAIGGKSEFASASSSVVAAIIKMKSALKV